MNFLKFASQKLNLRWGTGADEIEVSSGSKDDSTVIASFPHSKSELLECLVDEMFVREDAGSRSPVLNTHDAFHSGLNRVIFFYDDPAEVLCRQFAEFSWSKDRLSDIDTYCEQQFVAWQTHTESYLNAAFNQECSLHAVSFESLQHHPVETLGEVCGFLGHTANRMECRNVVLEHLQQATGQRAWFPRAANVQSSSISARHQLEPETYNLIQNKAQVLYRRAMMMGPEKMAG